MGQIDSKQKYPIKIKRVSFTNTKYEFQVYEFKISGIRKEMCGKLKNFYLRPSQKKNSCAKQRSKKILENKLKIPWHSLVDLVSGFVCDGNYFC